MSDTANVLNPGMNLGVPVAAAGVENTINIPAPQGESILSSVPMGDNNAIATAIAMPTPLAGPAAQPLVVAPTPASGQTIQSEIHALNKETQAVKKETQAVDTNTEAVQNQIVAEHQQTAALEKLTGVLEKLASHIQTPVNVECNNSNLAAAGAASLGTPAPIVNPPIDLQQSVPSLAV